MKPALLIFVLLAGLLLTLTGCPSATPTTSTEPAPATTTPAETTMPTTSSQPTTTPAETTPPQTSAPTTTPPATAPTGAGVIRLFYYAHVATPNADPAALPGPHVIHSATSHDGLNFTEDAGTRFSYDTGGQFGITDPDVIQTDDGTWLMFVSLGMSLLKATADTSAGEYTLDPAFTWDQGGVAGSYNFGGVIRTFVTFNDEIHMATYDDADGTLSYNGVALSKPATGALQSPSVIEIDGTYLMFYLYRPTPQSEPRDHEIYLATSPDGLTWTQHAQNRFIGNGSVPGAVYYNNTIYIYCCGIPSTPGDFGVYVSSDGGQTFSQSPAVIAGKALSGAVDPAAIVVDEQD